MFVCVLQKRKHRQLQTVLCGRCRLLSHGHMITAVGGNGGYPGGKQFVTAEELREKLSHLRHENALIVKLVTVFAMVLNFVKLVFLDLGRMFLFLFFWCSSLFQLS